MSLLTARNQLVRMKDTAAKAIEEIDEFLATLGVSVDNPSPGQVVKTRRGRKPGSKNKPKAPASGEPATPETAPVVETPSEPQAVAS